ncbi:hypothetical protein [Erythrobacter sp. Alg231-14]|uniref:hypothetical protein n=1 Tax=Erythrobacter sp. Alg231-14 TaxID=1922225 RepID=UPI000D5602DE
MRISTFIPISMTAIILAATANAQDNRSLVRENFQQADANDDDKLSRSEFRVFINENAKDEIGRASTVKRFGAYDRAFARLDANEDGFVTTAEMRSARSNR